MKAYKALIEPLVSPRSRERVGLLRKRWQSLDAQLKFPQQVAGVTHVACGATHGVMEKCNFACTSCYLTDIANYTAPLPFEAVKAQLDALRAHLGPEGKAQITAGEVTLLPVGTLGRIVAYARAIGLDPMLMTNGQRLLDIPSYLHQLVAEHGLEKIAIHIDTTQKGRRELRLGMSEADLNPVRDRFAALLKVVRERTGVEVKAAHTVTVSNRNLDGVADVMAWMLDNLDAFRMVSFQPVAAVGRTSDPRAEMSLDEVWDRVCEGAGQRLNRHAMYFGHPSCNIVTPLLVVSFGRHRYIVEAVREGKRWDLAAFGRVARHSRGFVTVHATPMRAILGIISLALRNPSLSVELPFYALYRLWGIRRWLVPFLLHVITFRRPTVRPLAIVIHKFMSPDELETPLGRERLDACVFKVPVDGRMVSMCELNATPLRRDLNRRLQTQTVEGG